MRKTLIAQAEKIGLTLSPEQAEKFEVYHEMLIDANRKMNLTRVPEDIQEAVDRNYLDSIAPAALPPFSGAKSAVDVGSGAGFPGVPLSILLPETHFVLLDALGKRVEFLDVVVRALSLNAETAHLRAEDAGRNPAWREQFDLAVSRAVAPINVLAELMLPLVRVGGRMLAYKGPAAGEELSEAARAIDALGGGPGQMHSIAIPGRDWAHSAVEIEKIAPTPDRYPRRAGMPEKKPIV